MDTVSQNTRENAAGAFRDVRNTLLGIKDGITALIKEVARFMLNAEKEYVTFRDMMKPYVLYFYNTGTAAGEDTFVGEVVIPTQNDMNGAINQVVMHMGDDVRINQNLENAIRKTLMLKENIDGIINVVEDIEIYFLNTMIISVKAGTEGQSLTKLSEEMGKLSSVINSISSQFRSMIDELNAEYGRFTGIKDEIEIINENYLTNMKISLRIVFEDLINLIKNVSVDVNNIMGISDDVDSLMRKVITHLQMEDLFRQDVEKIAFFIDYFIMDTGSLSEIRGSVFDEKTFDEMVACVLCDRIDNTRANIKGLNEKVTDYLDMMGKLAATIMQKLSDTRDEEVTRKNSGIDDTYSLVENMKEEFIGNIEKIISGKFRIYELSVKIKEIAARFNDFFLNIKSIAKRFEVVNLLTKIEVARNVHLHSAIGGTLSEISRLPVHIKDKIEETVVFYNEVLVDMDRAVEGYYAIFRQQEGALRGSIDAMKKISVKLYESKKYYADITDRILGDSHSVALFVDSKNESRERMKSMEELVASLGEKIAGSAGGKLSIAEFLKSNRKKMKELHSLIDMTRREGDYRMMMISSLLAELLEEHRTGEITFF